jgi:protein TonB
METVLADLDEIVFEGREKDYGAYQLRRNYRRYLTRAALIAFLLFCGGAAIPKFASWFYVPPVEKEEEFMETEKVVMDETPEEEKKEEEIIIEEIKPVVETFAFVAPEPDKTAEDTSTINFNEDKKDMDFGFQNQQSDLKDDEWDKIDDRKDDVVTIPDDDDVDPNAFMILDKEPAAVNLDDVKALIGYPDMAKAAEITGKVTVRIQVDREGKYTKHIVLKDPHPILTNAVTSKLPLLKFTPGIQGGKPVKVWITIPFEFKLNK